MASEIPQNWPETTVSQTPVYPELSEETKETNKELYELYTWTDAYTYIDLFFSFNEEAEKWVLEKQYEGHIDQHIITLVESFSFKKWKMILFEYARAGYDYQTGKLVLKGPISHSNQYSDDGEEEVWEWEFETREEIEYDARFFPSAK